MLRKSGTSYELRWDRGTGIIQREEKRPYRSRGHKGGRTRNYTEGGGEAIQITGLQRERARDYTEGGIGVEERREE